MKEIYDAAIIGGGAAGLAAAYELIKAGFKNVIIFEKENFLGGAIKPVKIGNYHIEGFYHHLLINDHYLFKLSKDLGFEIKFTPTQTAFLFIDAFYKLSNAYDLIKFKKLSFLERIILAKFLVKILLIKNIAAYDEIEAAEWIKKNVGPRIYRIFFEPMLYAKFGGELQKISAAWFLGRIKIRSNRSKKGESLGYIKGSLNVMLLSLGNYIKSNGGEILLNSFVKTIEKQPDGSFKIISDRLIINAATVISSVSPAVLLKLIDFPVDYRKNLEKLKCQKNICFLLGLKKKLSEFYWINIMDKDMSFKAVIEHTNFQEITEYKETVIYLTNYVDDNSAQWTMEDKDIIEIYLSDLKKIFPAFEKNDINWIQIHKTDNAGLVYYTGIRKLMPDCISPINAFFIGGMINSYPERPINTACLQGVKCARLASEYLLKKQLPHIS